MAILTIAKAVSETKIPVSCHSILFAENHCLIKSRTRGSLAKIGISGRSLFSRILRKVDHNGDDD